MWIITVHLNRNIKMFEFDSEDEAIAAFNRTQGHKILTEIIYFNDDRLTNVHQTVPSP